MIRTRLTRRLLIGLTPVAITGCLKPELSNGAYSNLSSIQFEYTSIEGDPPYLRIRHRGGASVPAVRLFVTINGETVFDAGDILRGFDRGPKVRNEWRNEVTEGDRLVVSVNYDDSDQWPVAIHHQNEDGEPVEPIDSKEVSPP